MQLRSLENKHDRKPPPQLLLGVPPATAAISSPVSSRIPSRFMLGTPRLPDPKIILAQNGPR